MSGLPAEFLRAENPLVTMGSL